MISNVGFDPASGHIGYPGLTVTGFQPGETYVFRFRLLEASGTSTDGTYGFAILTGVSSSAVFWVTPHLDPLKVVVGGNVYYEFGYTVPRNGPVLNAYFCAISKIGQGLSTPTSDSVLVVFDDLTIERRGHYVQGDLDGATLQQALSAVLVDREGSLRVRSVRPTLPRSMPRPDTKSGSTRKSQPNTLDLVIEIVDNWNGVVYTDADDVIRTGVLSDPDDDDDDVVALFGESNMSDADIESFAITPDTAPGLTRLFPSGRIARSW